MSSAITLALIIYYYLGYLGKTFDVIIQTSQMNKLINQLPMPWIWIYSGKNSEMWTLKHETRRSKYAQLDFEDQIA